MHDDTSSPPSSSPQQQQDIDPRYTINAKLANVIIRNSINNKSRFDVFKSDGKTFITEIGAKNHKTYFDHLDAHGYEYAEEKFDKRRKRIANNPSLKVYYESRVLWFHVENPVILMPCDVSYRVAV